jgi:uncharacterized protein DUF6600
MRHDNSFARVRGRCAALMIAFMSLVAGTLAAAATDPPGRVARVNFLEGTAAMQAAGVEGWTDDLLNRPLTSGDRVWIDEGSRAEMHVGSTALRLGSRTAVQVLAVDDHSVRLSMTAGSVSVRILEFGMDERFDIDTPAGRVSLQQPGGYRLDVDDSNNRAYLAVWTGSAEVAGPSGAHTVREEQSAELAADADPAIDTASAGETDSLDLWAEDRDRNEQQSAAAQYVSRDVVGYQDLDGYGQWVAEPTYGIVWVPVVAAGWAPYHYGYWNWIAPWGWTWIASEPWGFAPCHYGRWVNARHGWAWVPGPRTGPRPVYAPALVAWRGERYPKTNPDVQHRPKVGWVPLGYNEVYEPPFRASRDYLRAANLSNTHLGHGEVERYIDERQHGGARGPERRYANDGVTGAYAEAPREAFASTKASGPPRVLAEPNDAMQAKFAPHEVLRAAPVDRPLARPVGYVGYAAVNTPDRPTPQASAHTRVESAPPVDRPPRQAQTIVNGAPQISYGAPPPPRRQMQPTAGESTPPADRSPRQQTIADRPAQVSHGAVPQSHPQNPPAAAESAPRQYAPAAAHGGPPPSSAAVMGGDGHAQVGRPVPQP